jgi:hypothetical protein
VATFYAPADESQRRQANEILTEWQSSPSSLDVAMAIVRDDLNLHTVFIASQALESIIDSNYDDISHAVIHTVVETMTTRACSEISPPDPPALNCIIHCAMIISLHCSFYMENWRTYFSSHAIQYFASLFEYIAEHPFSPFDPRHKPVQFLACHTLVGVLADHDLSPEWFVLARHLLPYFSNFRHFIGFLPAFQAAKQMPVLFATFFDFFNAILDREYLNMSVADGDFVEEMMDIFLDVASLAIQPPFNSCGIQCACLVGKTIFDFSEYFLVDSRHRCFLENAFAVLDAWIPVLFQEPQELLDLLLAVSAAIRVMICAPGACPWDACCKFIQAMVGLVDLDFDAWRGLGPAFKAVSSPAGSSRCPAPVIEYYESCLCKPSNGLLYAVACSHDAVKAVCVPTLVPFALSDDAIPAVMLVFVEHGALHLGESQQVGFRRLFARLDCEAGPDLTAAIWTLSRSCLPLFLNFPEVLIAPILRVIPEIDPLTVVPLLFTLAHIQLGTSNTAIIERIDAPVRMAIDNAVTNLIEDTPSLFQFLERLVGGYNERELSIMSGWFCIVFARVSELMNELWNARDEQIQAALCAFVRLGFERGLIPDLNPVLDWLLEMLAALPLAEHMGLLRSHITQFIPLMTERFANGTLQKLVDFVHWFASFEDSELALQTVSVVCVLAQTRWPPFFECFQPDFLLTAIRSPDERIVEIGLQILYQIISQAEMRPLIDIIVADLLNGLFTGFSDLSIRYCIDILIAIVKNGICGPSDVVAMIFKNLKFQSREAKEFKRVFAECTTPDREQIFYATKRMTRLYRRHI